MLLELFILFLKLGAFTIGGGVAMIPILRRIMVEDKKWFTDEEMVDIIAISQGLPGVIAINMATFVGFRKKGLLGSLVATIGVILPSFVIILLLAEGIANFGDNPYALGAMAGLRAAAIGLIAVAVWQVRAIAADGLQKVILAVLAFAAIAFFNVSVAIVVLIFLLGGALAGILSEKSGGGRK